MRRGLLGLRRLRPSFSLRRRLFSVAPAPKEFDLIIVGGGSGGLALSREAVNLGAKVALLDFVKPSPQGTGWGLGGTCVNVGCIPKKLMHQAALIGELAHDSPSYGWNFLPAAPASATPDPLAEPPKPHLPHDWSTMVSRVQEYIRSLNWGYRVRLRDDKITYFNAFGSFVDANTIEAKQKNGKTELLRSKYFAIAVGGRPRPLDIPGGELAISSDDIFALKKPPGKTLCIGASYVALECAGFLNGLGYNTTVMARSVFLRGFDQQCASLIAEYMQNHGVRTLNPATPLSLRKNESNGKIVVKYKIGNEEKEEEFDTVFSAIGRDPAINGLNLDKAGVQTHPSSKKIVVHSGETTSQKNIFAFGDVIHGGLELTPVAIRAGRLLARRLFGSSKQQMDYAHVPTTVFTPIEYSCCGLSEEDALKKFGAENIEVYHSHFQPLEWALPHREDNACYAKIICNKADKERVVGLHYVGPNAGEVMQGFAAAMKLGVTKDQLEDTIGIHPTTAEEFTTIHITKRSGASPKKTGC